MKFIILFIVFFVTLAVALPKPNKDAEITEFENDASDKDRYSFA